MPFDEVPQLQGAGPFPTSGLPDWGGARAILLVDLDAFFASVEQLDHPGWRGKPVIVGGSPTRRGVVSTASYEARAFGVHSAMPSSTAAALCPHAIWTEGRFARYRAVSRQVMDVLLDESPFMRQVSIDEAFLDVTPGRARGDHPVLVAARIQRRVAELGVTCSIGVATTRSVAKIASDRDKPRGLTVVYPGQERGFLQRLSLRELSGIGEAAERKLNGMGIRTLGDLMDASDERVLRALGKQGATMLARVRGTEDDAVRPEREVKSVSSETSFAVDASTVEEVRAALFAMAAKVGRRLRRAGLEASTVTVKVRYADRTAHTAQQRLSAATNSDFALREVALELLPKVWAPGMRLRLVGIAASGFGAHEAFQPSLFDDGQDAAAPAKGHRRPRNADALLSAADAVRERFGEKAVQFGHERRTQQNTTGSSSKNPADYLD
ncbi:DNA polymerase IV [Eggerthellaceae bacterium zg-997]|nr:DNA polymerase IV [Eggerthellaceae bacterium zg-997]